jgi:hypothetical protein
MKKKRIKMDIIAISVEIVGKPPNGYVSGGYGPPFGAEKTRPPPKIIAMVLHLEEVRIRKRKKKTRENEFLGKKDGMPTDKGPTCFEGVLLTVFLDTQGVHAIVIVPRKAPIQAKAGCRSGHNASLREEVKKGRGGLPGPI